MDTTGRVRVSSLRRRGGVGLAASSSPRRPRRVFAPCRATRSGAGEEPGADAVINYVKNRFADEVLRLTGRRGVDLILDAVGKPTFRGGPSLSGRLREHRSSTDRGGAPDPLTCRPLPEVSES